MIKQLFLSALKNTQGALALISVITILAVGLVIGVTIVLNNLSQLDMGLAASKSQNAQALADAGVDEALFRLQRDSNYSGGSLSLNGGNCIITVVGQRIFVAATIEKWVKTIRLEFSSSPSWRIVNWQEI